MPHVLHLIDTLSPGGAERMAVSLANHLAERGYAVSLCASRSSGVLEQQVQLGVRFFCLQRKHRWDGAAFRRLLQFCRQERVQIVHAHSTSLFLGVMLSLFLPSTRLIWHDHSGKQDVEARPVHVYRVFARRADSVFTVTRVLQEWVIEVLGLPRERVVYLPNFVEPWGEVPPVEHLPGLPGKRIVCVANLRPQKDHLTLVRAMARVFQDHPDAHLLLVGSESDLNTVRQVEKEIQHLGLNHRITRLGMRKDIPAILAGCDVGVLSSVSEGFPVVLLEYGYAGLPVVSTRVGECDAILEEGKAGFLVAPGEVEKMAQALSQLLGDSALRKEMGKRLRQRVLDHFSPSVILDRVCERYEYLLVSKK